MADKLKAKSTPVRAYPHPSDSRPNIPTAELESFPRPEENSVAIVRYPRDPTLDPQLVWKGKDEQCALSGEYAASAARELGHTHRETPLSHIQRHAALLITLDSAPLGFV